MLPAFKIPLEFKFLARVLRTLFIINPVFTDFLCVMTHTVFLFIQHGQTALDRARQGNEHEVVQYLKEVGKCISS